ncbi:MAG: hypothetical protein R6W78_08865 [Bacteroidales bacterium]
MSKMYVFAIGGTGTRVLKSLVMLLAAGLPSDVDEIVPMIIDTDINNGDLERFRRIHNDYERIHSACYQNMSSSMFKDRFFRTKISKPKEISISGTSFGTLGDMIDYNGLNASGHKETKLLIDLLFDKDVMKMKLEKGFMGNPNVGSIVLKHVINSQGFRDFTQDFRQGDRIFIINSIFGGTGAAGFPLLLKLFRDNQSTINNIGLINNSIIGAVTVLPYFEVDVTKFQSGESAINSDTFITKTKAALSYYDRHVGHLINALFYIGDTQRSNFENFDGGPSQKNPSNFIEFASALAILHFANFEKEAKEATQLSFPSQYFEFGIDRDLDLFNLNHLKKTNAHLMKQLVAFKYLSVYLSNFLKAAIDNKKLAWRNELGIPDSYDKNQFVKHLKSFCNVHFFNYLMELSWEKQGRKFAPFNLYLDATVQDNNEEIKDPPILDLNNDKLFSLVNEIPARRKDSLLKKDSIKFDQIISDVAVGAKEDDYSTTDLKFLDVLSRAMYQVFDERFKF